MMGEHSRLSHGDSKALYGAAGDEAASKHFCARWGCVQWLMMLTFMLVGKVLIGFSIACLLGFKGASEKEISLSGCAALAVLGALFIYAALGPNAPTVLCVEVDDDKCELHFHRRLRGPICRDLRDVVGLLEMGWVSPRGFYASVEAGFATGTPTWELIFRDGGSWIFTLQDHEGFLKHLSQVCLSTNHPVSDQLLTMIGGGV
eukprot:TRINITY_DN3199_c0_g2_i1.p1 TRINITY_DN3199_c0_g2~~TRINITY_DN3199_c0_g2_i1.p1  ORF type:complete len:215 (+),score=10.52 TRINITY_DN3199_c0_g2_i1:39-647(+)